MIITRMEDKVLRFKKFFDLNFPKVKTFAWQLLKSEEDAEDIAQDIFVKLWDNPEIWENKETWDSYIYTMARKHQIEMPITKALYEVLYEKKSPSIALAELMGRDIKIEVS